MQLLSEALRRSGDRPNRFVAQAAIAACHAVAPSWSATDWTAIVSWYDVLLAVDPSPVVALNRAVALGERDGPAVGLAALDLVDLQPGADQPLGDGVGGGEQGARDLGLG